MKKSLLISAMAVFGLTSSAFAATSPDAGFYMGLSGGFDMTNDQNQENLIIPCGCRVIDAHGDHGFASRVFVGYDINRYFAVESGYSYFFNDVTMDRVSEKGMFYEVDASNHMVFDLYGKGKLPLIKNFDLYAKLGANLYKTCMNTRMSTGMSSSPDNKNNVNISFGAGADYYIRSNVIANFEWLRVNSNARASDTQYQPNADVFLLGLRYKLDL